MSDVGKVDAYMPIFWGDYLKDTGDLTLEEHGAYLLLMGHMWSRGGNIPADHARLGRLLGVTPLDFGRLWVGIGRFFAPSGEGLLMQRRLLAELDKARARKQAASDAGKASAEARSQRAFNERSTVVPTEPPTEGQRKFNSASASASASASPSPTATALGENRALVRTAPQPKPPVTRAQKQDANLFEAALGTWGALWAERFGTEYIPTGPDKSNLGRMISPLTRDQFDRIPECMGRYLWDPEPFVAKQGFSLTFFCTGGGGGLNKYGIDVPVLSQKEATGIAAGRRWIGRKQRESGNAER